MAKRCILITHQKNAILLGMRLFSKISENPPRTSLHTYDDKSDPTEYRIPLLHEDEDQLFYSTQSDQWRHGLRSNAVSYEEKAQRFNVRPKVNVKSVEHFNHKRFDKTSRNAIKQFSEFYDSMSYHELSDIKKRSVISPQKIRQTLKQQKTKDLLLYDNFSGSGWSHIQFCGQSYGPPSKIKEDGSLEYDTRFNSKVLQMDFRGRYFSKGIQNGFRTTVAVGNGKGLLGVGMTFHPIAREALKEAKQYAYMQLVPFPMTETGSIPYATRGRFHRTELHAVPAMTYQENKGHRVVKELLDLAGYQNVGVKLFGRSPTESIVKAFFVTFQNFESHQEQADRLGRFVTQFDADTYFMPKVLAEPRDSSKPVPYSAEIHESSQGIIS